MRWLGRADPWGSGGGMGEFRRTDGCVLHVRRAGMALSGHLRCPASGALQDDGSYDEVGFLLS